MNKNFNLDEIAKEFEEYYSKSRGMTLMAHGIDVAGHIEFSAKVAFFAGYGCGLAKAESVLNRIN